MSAAAGPISVTFSIVAAHERQERLERDRRDPADLVEQPDQVVGGDARGRVVPHPILIVDLHRGQLELLGQDTRLRVAGDRTPRPGQPGAPGVHRRKRLERVERADARAGTADNASSPRAPDRWMTNVRGRTDGASAAAAASIARIRGRDDHEIDPGARVRHSDCRRVEASGRGTRARVIGRPARDDGDRPAAIRERGSDGRAGPARADERQRTRMFDAVHQIHPSLAVPAQRVRTGSREA